MFKLPLLALRDTVLFPGIIAPIFIGREKSLKALFASKKQGDGQYILLTAQKDHNQDDPKEEDLYFIGVLAKIIQTVKLPNENAKVLVEIIDRVLLSKIYTDDFLAADYSILPDKEEDNLELLEVAISSVMQLFSEYVKSNKKINPEILSLIKESKNSGYITNILASHLSSSISLKQNLLEEVNILKRANLLVELITTAKVQMEVEQDVQQRLKKQVEQTQRIYYLQEQMKAIQKELNGEEDKSDLLEIENKIKTMQLSQEAKEKAESELKKLKMMNQMSAESSVIRNYLDTLLSMPWGKYDKSKISIKRTEALLNRDHYGLEKVKERILEHLAVLQRSKKVKGPILCLIGPPGVGKTSLVKSISEAMGRQYAKFSLGGVRDEAEIRGHRRTYLGSMPGRVINLLKKVKVSNPVMLLDEIDKMGSDFRGDPAFALLEVLDPEQNKHFVDHYLEVEYDLSDIIFIATANSYNLPRMLLDRMEVINIAGYVEEEKVQIAKNYLIPKQMKIHSIRKGEIIISDAALLNLIRYYTKESGVRSLEREIGSLIRKGLKKILNNNCSINSIKSLFIRDIDLEKYLGFPKYRFGLADDKSKIGSTTGLAYTELGGDLLTIEALAFPGKGEVKTTGKLGEVMKESIQAAYSCFRDRAENLGIKYEDYKNLDIHLHVPEGAIPKDGPSAGIAIFTTIVSLLTHKPVKNTIAMTGEITLLGKILPIGGLKEKLLAASRGGIKTVLIPEENIKDLSEIPSGIKSILEILTVSNIDQVLELALEK